MTFDDARTMRAIAAALDQAGIEYRVGGSIASSMHGVGRSTQDIDLVLDMRREDISKLIQTLGDDFYVAEDAVRFAFDHNTAFNVIYIPTAQKVDLFVRPQRAFDMWAWKRAIVDRPFEQDEQTYPIVSAEDIILSKLEWFRRGGERSERQWSDVIGVIKVQGDALDQDYLEHWSEELHVRDLLRRALRQATGGDSLDTPLDR